MVTIFGRVGCLGTQVFATLIHQVDDSVFDEAAADVSRYAPNPTSDPCPLNPQPQNPKPSTLNSEA